MFKFTCSMTHSFKQYIICNVYYNVYIKTTHLIKVQINVDVNFSFDLQIITSMLTRRVHQGCSQRYFLTFNLWGLGWQCVRCVRLLRGAGEGDKGRQLQRSCGRCTWSCLRALRDDDRQARPGRVKNNIIITQHLVFNLSNQLYLSSGWSFLTSWRAPWCGLSWPERWRCRSFVWLVGGAAAYSELLAGRNPSLRSLDTPECVSSYTGGQRQRHNARQQFLHLPVYTKKWSEDCWYCYKHAKCVDLVYKSIQNLRCVSVVTPCVTVCPQKQSHYVELSRFSDMSQFSKVWQAHFCLASNKKQVKLLKWLLCQCIGQNLQNYLM